MAPGVYRRRIRIESRPGHARAEMEDDFHRFTVLVHHDSYRVTGIEGRPMRTPWELCPEATAVLDRAVGMLLSPDPTAVYEHTNGKQQCTHMFDLAGLASAHAARAIALCQYDVEISYWHSQGAREMSLKRDGKTVLEWVVEKGVIMSPDAFAGQNLRPLLEWTRTACPDPDDFEAVAILRRAVAISRGRLIDTEAMPNAGAIPALMGGCFVFQPERAEHTAPRRGSRRDFTGSPLELLADRDPGWFGA